MAKGVFKGNNKLVLALAIAFVAVVLFYTVKRMEGFQNNPTVPVGPPTKVPAKATMPNMNNADSKNILDNLMPNTNTENAPISETQPSTTAQSATTVAVVKAKLDELKTLVDSM